MKPFATVLIRTYNSRSTIERALQSVFNQTIDDSKYTVLLVDDGSTDDTLNIVEKYSSISLIESGHKGALKALNLGLQNVDTEFVIMLDSDDWFEPEILEKMSLVISENPDVDLIYCDYYEVTGTKKKIVKVKENIFHTLAAGILFSMEILRSNDFYDECLIFSEYDLLIRILPTAKKKYIEQPLYNYYRHKDSISADRSFYEKGKKQLYEKYGKDFQIREY